MLRWTGNLEKNVWLHQSMILERGTPLGARVQPLVTIPEGGGPLHRRLYDQIRSLILQGALRHGTKLPSSRQVSKDLNISRNTVLRAVERLIDEGLIETKKNSGYYVASNNFTHPDADAYISPADNERWIRALPFEIGQSSIDLFPRERWRKVQETVWTGERRAVLYPSAPGGDPLLRQTIARLVCPARGFTCDPRRILITTSLQMSLQILYLSLGLANCEVVLEDPGYPRARQVFERLGCKAIGGPTDSDGLQVDVARALAPQARFVYVTPTVQFPTCAQLSNARRSKLIEWMAETEGIVLEDDYDGHFRFDRMPTLPPMLTQAPDRVAYVGTFNRLLFPGVRLAFMVVPPGLVERAHAAQVAIDGVPSIAGQLVLRKFIDEGEFTRQIRLCRGALEERRNALLTVLNPFLGNLFHRIINPVGLHLVLRPRKLAEAKILGAIRTAGLAATGTQELAVDPAAAREGIILGFAAFSPKEIAVYGATLRDALNSL
jgi:GntR family transcriptional regulator/MocR family aminotransferase